MLNVIEKHKRIKVGGVAFIIKQLPPVLFMDSKEIIPINNILEKIDPKTSIEEKLQEIKDSIRKILLKGVVNVRHWFASKKIDMILDVIMEKPEIYNYLFISIINHSLGIKKKVSHLFTLNENLRSLFTI